MSVEDHRKCAMCGKARCDDDTVTYHRFPNPGTTNIVKARAWAEYCWPNQDWTSKQSLESLNKSHKVLCGRHFTDIQFYDNQRLKLSKFAIPDAATLSALQENKENVNTQNEQEPNILQSQTSKILGELKECRTTSSPSTSQAIVIPKPEIIKKVQATADTKTKKRGGILQELNLKKISELTYTELKLYEMCKKYLDHWMKRIGVGRWKKNKNLEKQINE